MTKLTNEQLASMSPWTIADAFGCSFSGDMNPIEHGGFFYDHRDWNDNGYASAVEFWEDPESGDLVVQRGTINKPDDMESAFACLGYTEEDDDLRNHLAIQVEAARAYSGIEPDGTAYPHLKVFKLDDWKERNIWKSIRRWIEQLGE